eukprot:TRINITY_DN23733_c0_g1_i1.p1 TRINITY_DN23733_c0_g1~~TRINITY_DN23733_c0_g1_i1.p1  ORF type:complete len:712 (-),score=170.95 TRINITY_DN23733_c0_g1_i1:152-2287(-)
MPWVLIPLHLLESPPIALPRGGTATIGRRASNFIVCKDLAVSGQHCILHCPRATTVLDPPEVEDVSTNGTYVNDQKLAKGDRHRLGLSDVIALTKQPEEDPTGAEGARRIQYRVEFKDEQREPSPPVEALGPPPAGPPPVQTHVVGEDPPPTMPEHGVRSPVGPAGANEGSQAPWMSTSAQNLLVQEQQSKAKITSELLLSQRKLEEERTAVEGMSRELRKLRQQAEEERSRRCEVEEVRDRHNGEAEVLRAERRQLDELRVSHGDLKQRHEATDTDLQAQRTRHGQLQAATDKLRHEVERANAARQKSSQQHVELTMRMRQAQERANRLEQQLADAKRETERAIEEGARLQKELDAERELRTKLDEQVEEAKAQVSEAEASERAAREQLDGATARRAELECQANSAQADVEGARVNCRQARQRLVSARQTVECFRQSGQLLASEFRRRADIWEKAVNENSFQEIEEMCRIAVSASCVTATVVTHRQDDDHEDRPHQVDGAATRGEELSVTPERSDGRREGGGGAAGSPPTTPGGGGIVGGRCEAVAASTASGDAFSPQATAVEVTEVISPSPARSVVARAADGHGAAQAPAEARAAAATVTAFEGHPRKATRMSSILLRGVDDGELAGTAVGLVDEDKADADHGRSAGGRGGGDHGFMGVGNPPVSFVGTGRRVPDQRVHGHDVAGEACSTAWSLELLEDVHPLAKRPRY